MENYKSLHAEIMQRLQKELKDKRYRHTLGVESAAIALARRFGADEKEASIAALLHDVAKYVPVEEQIALIRDTEIGRRFPNIGQYPKLLHAFAGAEICAKDYPMLSESVINAVRYHTTGRSHMDLLEKIIFAADYIETGRVRFIGLQEAREQTFANLDQGVELILKQTIAYLKSNEQPCFALTQEAYDYFTKSSTLGLENEEEL